MVEARPAVGLCAALCCALACGGGTNRGPRGTAGPARAADGRATGVIAGVVRDTAAGGAGVGFAAVEAVENRAGGAPAHAGATSSADGSFRLVVPAGRYRVSAAYARLGAELPDVVVLPGATTTLHIDLDSRGPPAAGPSSVASAAHRTGEIAGRVVDIGSSQPFPGAVVAVTSPALADAQMAVSGADGRYRLPGLPPGTYTVTVYYQLIDRGAIELRRTGVEVTAGRATRVDLSIDLRVKR